jgi:hypothetical protein
VPDEAHQRVGGQMETRDRKVKGALEKVDRWTE